MALYDPDQQPVVTTAAEAVLAAAQAGPEQFAARLYGGTAESVLNFVKLATYLRTLPEDYREFSMGHYFSSGQSEPSPAPTQVQAIGHPCGSVACAVGHAVAAGIAPQLGEYSWADYGSRCFTEFYDDYVFCFGGYWWSVDDTPRGAAARICYLLAGGSAGVAALGTYDLKGMPKHYRQYLA